MSLLTAVPLPVSLDHVPDTAGDPVLQWSARLADHVAQAGLVDLDGTIFIQFGLFALLVLVLPGLIFNPMLARIEQREARTDGARADAKAMRHLADDQVAQYETAIAAQKRKALQERAETRVATMKMAADLLATARAETTERIDQGLALQRAQAEVARVELQRDADGLARQIATKLVEG
ncbi:MAG: hypothetical protein EXR79_07625 [Myxococcales bacterium]|nr:hypothetical protein [Myxococcales bacterium]